PQTRPSHATIMTGRYPYEHGIRDNYSPPLAASTPTLASVLRDHGWDTAGFIGAYPVARPSGLDRGFTVFDDPFGAGDATTREARTERQAAEVIDHALAWLGQPRAKPFFLWVHLFDPHAPYEPPSPWRERFARAPYDGEVAYADAQLGRLVAWLDAKGLRGQTLVVATADHGEGLGEHGEDEHMFFVYDSTLRVPLLFSWPGRLPAGARVRGQFRSVDLFATVLELAGVTAPPSSGASRSAFLQPDGRIPDNESYAETLYPQIHFGYAPLRALRAEGWKYIEAPRAELYRLPEDPGETRNLVRERASVAGAIRGRLASLDQAGVAPVLPALDPDAAARLATLGYVGGGPAPGGTGPGADPKDKVREVQAYQRDMRNAMRLYNARDVDGALRLFRRLAAFPGLPSFNVEYYLGRSLLEKRRFVEAIPHLEKAAQMAPARRTASGLAAAPMYAWLGQAYAGAGQDARALSTLEQGLAVAPANPELLRAKGSILVRRGDLAGARAVLEKARGLDPKDPRLHVELANLHRNLGDLPQALTEAQEALRLDPKSVEGHVARGLALGALRREEDAAAAFREALRLAPDDADALFYLGTVELRAGRAEAAVPLLARLVEKAPDYPQARATLDLARERNPAPPPGSVRLRLLRVPERSQADKIAARLKAGESFAAVARAESADASAARGGDLGNVTVGDLAEPLRSAAAGLAPGEISPVLDTPAGFVLLKRDR
ncbi:MAG TPA: sulfatase-like hydrolase/transferase, partial [Vicinamibacteria bacterium]|nr:sulfatase-like hydrolase/transferase [Vicinamibacteria bacterium]